MTYSLQEHSHRFSAWTAGRAASVNGCRFTVEKGRKILELSGLQKVSESVENLPSPSNFDADHEKWRKIIIRKANKLLCKEIFTHGVAAKLINVYLKSIFVCGAYYLGEKAKVIDSPKVKAIQKINAIHPPIDSVLLNELCRLNNCEREQILEFKKAKRIRWSNLDSDQYNNLISAIKAFIPSNQGLWRIEEHWRGFQ